MRASVWLAGIMTLASCGKQLNPEYCLHNNTDSDCYDAGLVFLDAAPPCTDNSMCPGAICDVSRGECVQCTATEHSACGASTPYCTNADTCVGCLTDSQCTSNLCVQATGTCASLDRILYVTPNGPSTGTNICRSTGAPCNLTTALTVARTDPTSPGDIIHMEGGTYAEGPLTLDIANLTIIVATGQAATITDGGANGPILNVTAGPVEIDDVTLDTAKGDDALKCTNATMTLNHVTLSNNPHDGVHATGCTVTIVRSTFSNNHESAMYFDDTNITVWNNFVHDNGNSNLTDGVISLQGHTGGSIRFNTLAFNHAHAKQNKFDLDFSAGVQCQNDHGTTDRDGLFIDNSPLSFATDFHFACGNNFNNENWVGTASDVNFAGAMDLHLTAETPDQRFGQNDSKPAIRDNANTNGNGISVDIDGDPRQLNGACDYGADEYPGPFQQN
jgi:hypothetical protein